MATELDRLGQMTGDNPTRNARMREIHQLVWTRMNRLDQGIRVRQEQGFDAARETITSGLGKQEM